MTDFIIVIVLTIAVLLGLRSGVKHFKGEGGCCGGGDYKPRKKKLSAIVGRKTMIIEGMSCQHCENRVHEAINSIPGASADVSFRKGRAVVSMERELEDDVLRAAVEKAGYKVKEIR